jgi:hypothetical protein
MYGRIPGNKPEDAHLRVGKYVADTTVPCASVSHAGRFFMGNAGNTNSGFAKKELCNLSKKVCKFEQFKENRYIY